MSPRSAWVISTGGYLWVWSCCFDSDQIVTSRRFLFALSCMQHATLSLSWTNQIEGSWQVYPTFLLHYVISWNSFFFLSFYRQSVLIIDNSQFRNSHPYSGTSQHHTVLGHKSRGISLEISHRFYRSHRSLDVVRRARDINGFVCTITILKFLDQ